MEIQNNICDAIFGDKYLKNFNEGKCEKKAKWKIKINDKKCYLRCGTHARSFKNESKIPIEENTNQKNKKVKTKKDYNNKYNFNLNELLEYIESGKYRNDIPKEIENVFNEIDNLNNSIKSILNINNKN